LGGIAPDRSPPFSVLKVAGKAPVSRARAPIRQLTLQELHAHELPVTANVVGAAIANDGRIVYWGNGTVSLIARDKRIALPLCPAESRDIITAAFVEHDSVVEFFVHGDKTVVYRVEPHNKCTRSVTVTAIDDEVVSAARTTDGWIVGVVTARLSSATFSVAHDGSLRRLTPWEEAGQDPWDLRFSHLARETKGFIIASFRWPFTWVLLDSLGAVSKLSGPLAGGSPEISEGPSDLREWIGLPVVALDRGFAQTLSDPRSDHRLLVLYDQAGRAIRHSQIEVPLGLLASSPEGRLLVALRRTDRLELVTYGWRWDAATK
jgi:hypothetical protein